MSHPLVSVITLTRDRPELLRRAMASADRQTGVQVEHVVVGDGATYLSDPGYRRILEHDFPAAVIINVPRSGSEVSEYLPARLGRLRNRGIAAATGEFVAQLDDDNEFEPDHLASLVATIESRPGLEAAHSWRRLVDADGNSYVPDGIDPWHPNPELRARSYAELAKIGVFEPGSDVVRDIFRAGNQIIARVDTSEFMIRKRLHSVVGYAEAFSKVRQQLQWTEDYVMALELARRRIEVGCSRKATLIYRMGGYSNSTPAAVPAGTGAAGICSQTRSWAKRALPSGESGPRLSDAACERNREPTTAILSRVPGIAGAEL